MARRRFLIDRIPDDALPRLQPRPLPYAIDKLVLLLVSLRDCAPYLETWPPDLDELSEVATRLLLVPGGPLVLEDGKTLRLRRPGPDEPVLVHGRIRALEIARGLVCLDSDLVWLDRDVPKCVSAAILVSLVSSVQDNLARTFFRCTGSGFRMSRACLLELAPLRTATDTMLAGLPEGGAS